MPWIAAAVMGTALTVKGITGFIQHRKGKKEMARLKGKRPQYTIPTGVTENERRAKERLKEAERETPGGLPEPTLQFGIENIQRAGQTGFAGAREQGKASAISGNIFQKQADAYRELLGMDVLTRERQKQWIQQNIQAYDRNLAQANLTSAGFQERQWDINQMQPYLQDYMAAQALVGTGWQNMAQAGSQAGNMAGMGASAFGGGQGTGGGQTPGGSAYTPSSSPNSLNLQTSEYPMRDYGGWQ